MPAHLRHLSASMALLAIMGCSGVDSTEHVFAMAEAEPTPKAKDDFEAPLRKFLDAHCTSCHGPDVQRAKLRLDSAASTLDKNAIRLKVHDRLRRGEMPPKGEPRPGEKDLAAAVAGLRKRLHADSLARQRREGRVAIRRLNRTEYETTLRDLLATPVEVKDLLPEDNVAAGFDNVGSALDVSPTHLLRYQQAAEKAVRAVIPNRPRASSDERRTGKQITQAMKLFEPMLGKSARLEKDTLVLHTRTYGHIPCATPPAPVAGRYRVRASAYAVATGGKPLPVMLVCRDLYGRDDNDVRGVRDVAAGKAGIIDGEFELKPREVIVFNGWSLASERDYAATMKGRKPDDKTPGLAVEWVEITGPLGDWPTAGYRSLFDKVLLEPQSAARARAEGRPIPPQPAKRPDGWWIYDPLVLSPAKPRDDAERLIRAFLPRAFRRPVADDLVEYYVKLAHAGLDKKLTFTEAMVRTYVAILCSPHFLMLVEKIDTERGTELDDYAIASRLSYFLWSSMPDEELIALAAKGGLKKSAVRHAQVERMLKDPKAHRLTENFAGQWLDLRNINATSPDPQIYGEFDDFLFWSMPRETELFFEEVLKEDRSLLEFVHSDWTFLNQRLAKHYAIGDIHGGELRKVKLPAESGRGGVLTHASIMKVTADGTRTSPVLRGKWVLERIVGLPPAPPPPDIPSIEPDIRGATTIRQQLDKHRNTPACATCHVHIDPPGFALESFDVIGGRRDFYRATGRTKAGTAKLPNYPERVVMRGPDVEKGGKTHDGKKFADVDEYKRLLLADEDQLARNLVEKLLIYSTGADLQFADREEVERLVKKCKEHKYGLRSLVHEIVQSRVFLQK